MITHHIVLFADRNAPSAPMEQAHAMTENITGHEKQAIETTSCTAKTRGSNKHSRMQGKHVAGSIKSVQQHVPNRNRRRDTWNRRRNISPKPMR